jgi:PAS domain S-box-containing protein
LQRTLPYRTADNHIEGVVLTFVDITARKTAQQSVAQIQARLQSALEQMPAAVILVDAPSGRIAHANKRAAELFGQAYPPPFLNVEWGAAVLALRGWHPGGAIYQAPEWPLARTLTSGAVVVDEHLEVLAIDGARRTLSVSSAPVRSDSGEIVAAVVAFWDITQLKNTERALRESERRLRLIVESAQDFAIILFDTAGIVTSWSAGAERMLGWTEEEILGQPATVFFTPADRDEQVLAQEMRIALEEGRSVDERWHLRKDGTAFWANGVVSVARDEGGPVIGFVKIMRDNTEQKEIADRLYAATSAATDAQRHAEAASRAKDDFISMVSHELRTPLNTMRLWMRLLGNPALPDKDRKEGHSTLERAVLAQQQLIDDLLDISRISAGKLRIEVRQTRLAEVIGSAIDSVRPVAVRRAVQLGYRASPDIGVVHADPDRMQQIVWNLLSNAIKFTPSGGRVAVDVSRDGEWVVIKVSDTGIGIRPEVLPRVFERFLQAQVGTARQHTGLGLGLTIVKQLVDLHGGGIVADSDGEGHGATFTIRLPLQSEATAAVHSQLPLDEGSTDLSGKRVLLVEDDSSTREGTRRLMKSAGAVVQAVESAAAGVEAYVSQPPDVIVSDVGMPGEDGYEFIQQVRSIEERQHSPRIPALALTAFAREEDRQKALAAGFDAHSSKPVDPERLLIQVAGLLGLRRAP